MPNFKMNRLSAVALLTGLSYTALNVLWLLAGNAGDFPETQRTVYKDSCLAAAVLVYVVATVVCAGRATTKPVLSAVVGSGGGLALGLVLIVLTGLVWPPARLFHDSTLTEQLPRLVAFVIGFTTAGSLVAAGIALVIALLRTSLAPER